VKIDFPPRLELAHTPTPLHRLSRTSAELGVEFWIKRDDLTGAALSGNKVRKLEFLFAEALEQRADTVVTCGGEQSNHCRATAIAASQVGLSCVLLLRTADPNNPPPFRGNIVLDRLAGAEIRWISHAQYARRHELFESVAEELRAAGRHPYVVPEGGSNAVGTWGYVLTCEELAAQIDSLPDKPTTIVYATGSGGTGAGLAVGAKMTGLRERGVRTAGFNVCDDRDYFVKAMTRIAADMRARWPAVPALDADELDIVDGYVGLGYAKSRAEELELLRDFVQREGIVLDPVYSGKAFYGLTRELAANPSRFGERVIFLHTGGIFGLLAKSEQLEPLL